MNISINLFDLPQQQEWGKFEVKFKGVILHSIGKHHVSFWKWIGDRLKFVGWDRESFDREPERFWNEAHERFKEMEEGKGRPSGA